MIVGAAKKRASAAPREAQGPIQPQVETNEQFILQSIENRDYSGAATFIEFLRDDLGQAYTKDLALWHGYSLFHLGEYSRAIYRPWSCWHRCASADRTSVANALRCAPTPRSSRPGPSTASAPQRLPFVGVSLMLSFDPSALRPSNVSFGIAYTRLRQIISRSVS
jgi:hypothetical protein